MKGLNFYKEFVLFPKSRARHLEILPNCYIIKTEENRRRRKTEEMLLIVKFINVKI